MKNVLEQIKAIFHEAYPKKYLAKAWKPYVVKFIASKKEYLLEKKDLSAIFDYGSIDSLSKDKMIVFCTIPFLDKDTFNLFLYSLPENIRLIFDELLWTDELTISDIKNKFKETPYIENKKLDHYHRNRFKIKSDYCLFNNKRHYYGINHSFFYLDKQLRRLIVDHYYNLPKEAEIIGLKEIGKTNLIFEGEKAILMELPKLIAYNKQGQIRKTKNFKVQKSSLNKINKALQTEEFYPKHPNKTKALLRTQLLASFIIFTNFDFNVNISQSLRNHFTDVYTKKYHSGVGLFFYYKGSTKIDEYYSTRAEQYYLDLLQKLPIEKWVSIENIKTNAKYQFIDYHVIRKHGLRDLEDENDSSFNLDEFTYNTRILDDSIKGMFFLFAAYGLLDLAYDESMESSSPPFSPYKDLKYIRLSQLGAYVFKRTNDYEPPKGVIKSETFVSNDSLTITIDVKDNISPVILAPYTEQVSPNRFRTDAVLFLKDVNDQKELHKKIESFKNALNIEFPKNWEAFFKELSSKVNPLKLFKAVSVYEIPPENKELMKLILNDEVLKKICIKAEGYRVIIKKNDLPILKNRLKEFGYLF